MLLIQSKTELMHTAKVSLRYDDNTTKEITITDGIFMLLKYRYNGNKNIDVVKVNKVKAIFKPLNPTQVIFDGAILVLDIAREFNSKRIHITTDDILNAKIITEESAMDFLEHWDEIDKSDALFEPEATKDDTMDIDPEFGVDDEPEEPTDPTPDDNKDQETENKGDISENPDSGKESETSNNDAESKESTDTE